MASLICFAGIQTTNKLSFSKQSLIIQEAKDTSLGDSSIPKGWEWKCKSFSDLKPKLTNVLSTPSYWSKSSPDSTVWQMGSSFWDMPKLANVLSTTSYWSKSSPDSTVWQMGSSSFWNIRCSHVTKEDVFWDGKYLWLFSPFSKDCCGVQHCWSVCCINCFCNLQFHKPRRWPDHSETRFTHLENKYNCFENLLT